ncbi:hypothetical protein T10_10970 [Trichinella papuae]|uniref:Uncharacterized protein n=1 Tax=Trichinella papuae TaxID=268474 RepID=A0A0V1N7V5_9BILA|nr:hypothetical protein T10_10970 [Trichinella papuae]
MAPQPSPACLLPSSEGEPSSEVAWPRNPLDSHFLDALLVFILFVGTNGRKSIGKDPSLEHTAKDYLSRGNHELNFPWTVLIERNILGFKSVRCLGSLIPSGNDNQTNLVVTSSNCFCKTKI